jgi:hypothetical protein
MIIDLVQYLALICIIFIKQLFTLQKKSLSLPVIIIQNIKLLYHILKIFQHQLQCFTNKNLLDF